jgi:hypothetical protein
MSKKKTTRTNKKASPGDKRLGNQYWRLGHDMGKPKKYQPNEILQKALEYAKWCEENPLYELKVFGTGVKIQVPKMRAMTIAGFCLFCNMDKSTWYEYEGQKDYSAVIARVRDLLYSQKFEGAAAEFLNAIIIARELGLSDKQELTGKGGKDLIPARTLTKEEAQEFLKKWEDEH